jgi:hypothetical protein
MAAEDGDERRARKGCDMRVKLAALVITALALAVVLTACDAFAEYTVINQTDEELLTWPLLEDCSVVVGKENDYLHEEVVRPHDRHTYFDAYSPALPEPRCVQVATMDRQLVLAERYEYGATYTVTEPVRPFGEPIPERGDLPGQSLGEFFGETPPFYLATLGLGILFGLGVIAGFLFALFLIVRFFYRFYVRKV